MGEYHAKPREGIVVLCFDECGPLELRPIHGQHWARRGQPVRFRATYKRQCGTEQLLGFYDVHGDCFAGTIHKRKTLRDILCAFKTLRRAYRATTRLFVIMDNLPLHKSQKLMNYYKHNNIEPIWTPTYSSWLNLIEAQFGAMKRAVLNCSDDRDHQPRRARIYRYVRYRNSQAGSSANPLAKMFKH